MTKEYPVSKLNPSRIGTALACISAFTALMASPAFAAPTPPPAPAVSTPVAVGNATLSRALDPDDLVPAAPMLDSTAPAPMTLNAAPANPAGTRASGLPWSDGGYFTHDAAQADAFAAWRGRPVDNIVAFTAQDTWPALLNPWWARAAPATFDAGRDDFILSVPLWTNDGDPGTDAQWAQLAAAMAAVDPDGYVRLGWEMNCCFSLTTDPGAWRTQFTRAATLIRAAAPGLRIVFNPNEGASSNNTIADPSVLYVDGIIDVIAIDAYDWYPAYTDGTTWAARRDKPLGWNYWYDFAQSNGLPFALAEFGVSSASSDSGGDNPAYFSYLYDWLAEKATQAPGSIAFVSVFNEAADYCQCNLHPATSNPNSAARYQTLLTALAGTSPAAGRQVTTENAPR